jgi:hypothetical protein
LFKSTSRLQPLRASAVKEKIVTFLTDPEGRKANRREPGPSICANGRAQETIELVHSTDYQ